jgi:hypothetical protein
MGTFVAGRLHWRWALDGNRADYLALRSLPYHGSFFVSAHLGRLDIITAVFGYSSDANSPAHRKNRVWSSSVGLLVLLFSKLIPPRGNFCSDDVAIFFEVLTAHFRTPDFWGFIAGVCVALLLSDFTSCQLHTFFTIENLCSALRIFRLLLPLI